MRVEPADERADTWLEETGPERDQDEAGVESRDGVERQRVVARGDDQAADQDRAPRADEVVRQIAPEDADHVAGHGVVAVDLGRELLVEPQATHRQWGDHEQEQERPHAVVGEALPHLGIEQHAQPPGVTAEAPMIPLGMPGRRFGVWGQLVHLWGYKEVKEGGGVGNHSPRMRVRVDNGGRRATFETQSQLA